MSASFRASLRHLHCSSLFQLQKGTASYAENAALRRLSSRLLPYHQQPPISRHLLSRCSISTMPRKSTKTGPMAKAGAALAAAAESPSILDGDRRRSSRRISSKPDYAESAVEDEGVAMPTPAQSDRGGQRQTKVQSGHDELKRAVESLDELDQNLLRAGKRQRRQIGASHVASDADGYIKQEAEGVERALSSTDQRAKGKPPRTKRKTSRVAVGRDISGGEEEEDGDDAYVVSDGDPEEGADDPVLEVAERGAARPPAVNSSYLPLPWTGRLGYVSATRVSVRGHLTC